jgi:protein-tyrosine phosphatase
MLKPLIPKKLVVGRAHDEGGPSLNELKNEGITAIVDLNQDAREKSEAEKMELEYPNDAKLKVPDNFEPIPMHRLEYITMTIHRLICEGHYVYLHCTASKGRSPTIAAAYLIRFLGKDKSEAMSQVKTVRPKAWSGSDKNFAGFLDEFEKKYRGKGALNN